MPLLQVLDVRKEYGTSKDGASDRRGVAALRGISIEVDAGDTVAVMGPSGCGKSTLLHLIGAMDRPTSGEVRLDGRSIGDLSDTELAELRRRDLGFVFQFFNLLPSLTVRENVALPLVLEGRERRLVHARTDELLERVGLAPRAEHYPAELSGGEMQRVAIARAVAGEPRLVLADEPTGSLDSENGRDVMHLLRDLNRDLGVTLIVATHNADVARFAKRRILMRDGIIEV